MLKQINGRKTAIGMALAIVAQAIPAIFGEAGEGVAEVVNYIALFFGGAGLGHKAYKGLTRSGDGK